MTDDIVTRLRIVSNLQKLHKSDDLVDDLLGFWLDEAADEIERLRAELKKQECCQEAANEIMRLRAIIAEYEQPIRIAPVSSAKRWGVF
jgi:hypothetical protein